MAERQEEEGGGLRWARALLTGEDPALADIRVTSRIVSDHLTATYFEARMQGPVECMVG